jgi:hypothetical protein
MPDMWGIIRKIKMFDCPAKSVVGGCPGQCRWWRSNGHGYRDVRV